MKLKNILFASLATVALVTGTSCSDSFLDEEMYSSYGTNVSDVNAKVLGLHYRVGEILGYSNRQGYPGIWQVGTDVGAPGDTEGVEVPFYQYADLNSENGGVSFLWTQLYNIIGAANSIIASATESTDPALVAEAKFFRAWSYNQLVTGWGDVPLIVEASASPKTDYTRNTVKEVDAVIAQDLTDAMASLPAVGNLVKEARISKDAARMLAGEAFLRMGMYDNSYFKKAEDAVSPIISEGNYQLIKERYGIHTADAGDYYSDMFRWGNQRRSQGNKEGIWTFEMEYASTVSGGTIGAPQQRRNWVAAFHKLAGMQNADSIGGRGNGRLRLSNYVKYGVFEEGDIRNSNHNIRRVMWYNKPNWSATIYVDANGWQVNEGQGTAVAVKTGDKVIPHIGDTLNVFYPHTTKWGGYDTADDFGWALTKDFPMMRFAEAYLLRAEARFRQGNTAGAADDINVLRDRAFQDYRLVSPEAGKVTSSQINIDFILDERIREMVGEENRRFTLMRTGELANRVNMMMSKWNEEAANKKTTGFDAKKHILLPIPLSEIQLNKDAELVQNPGY